MAEQDSAFPPVRQRKRGGKHAQQGGRSPLTMPWPRKTHQGIRRQPRLRVSGQ